MIIRKTCVDDLGVTFDLTLVNNVIVKSSKILGFLFRTCNNFTDVEALKCLYSSLFRFRLEYCSLVWFPFYIYQKLAIEKIQHKFWKPMFFKTYHRWPQRNYSQQQLLEQFEFKSLQCRCRRISNAVLFCHKLVNNKIDCSELLYLLKFRIPYIQ